MTIGNRIKLSRLQKRKTLEEVARAIGVSKQTVQKYESGVISNIPSDKIEALAKCLEVKPEYLMGWIDTNHDQTFSFDFHHAFIKMLSALGYQTYRDDPEHPLYLSSPNVSARLQLNDLQQLEDNVEAFIAFQVESLLRKRSDEDKEKERLDIARIKENLARQKDNSDQ